ncbi:MAG: hypothetical protein KDB23_04810 [Planctomycetales bacterium]|nr:hypothetical protein [Planctomycetales bacterium]
MRNTFLRLASACVIASACVVARGATRPGEFGDRSPSVIYDANTGRLSLERGWKGQAATIEIISASHQFIGPQPEFIRPPFDVFSESKIFMLRGGTCIPDGLDFGTVLPAGLSQEFLLGDLSIAGSGCGPWESTYRDLIYVPEPTFLAGESILLLLAIRRRIS